MIKKINKKTGKIGENVAVEFLTRNGFEIIDRNYQKRIGEIDIIAFKKGILHFFEVKTVSRETYGAYFSDVHKAEDNVTREKISKIEKTAHIFLKEKGFTDEYIQIDLITINIVKGSEEKYLVNYIPNINFV